MTEMTELTDDRLYELLPAIHRMRDEEQGFPLRALLRVLGEQAGVLEADIAQMYENLFIDTCDDWVVPYIGDLVGYRPVLDAGDPGARDSPAARNRISIPRREIANTIALRRRKGTLALLELLARDVAGWPARAVEFYKLLGWTQHLNFQHPQRGRTVDLRDGDALERLGGAFDSIAHSIDVRRIGSRQRQGRYNITCVGLFVYRLRAYSVTQTPAYLQEGKSGRRYSFSVLGNDTPLFVSPLAEENPDRIAQEVNLPVPIRRRALSKPDRTASEAFYGAGKSFSITAAGWPKKDAPQPVPAALIKVADLSDWEHYRAPRGFISVDPVLGRIAFPDSAPPTKGVRVSYHYGFSADMGGGEYPRVLSEPQDSKMYRVGQKETIKSISEALALWNTEKAARRQADPQARLAAVIEITDSDVYTEALNLELEVAESLQIRAANLRRPVLRLLDQVADRDDAFSVRGKRASRLLLDGLLITGRGIRVSPPETEEGSVPNDDLCDLRIRHCTLVPGWGVGCDCDPDKPNEPSIELLDTRASVSITHSIVGSILVSANEVTRDPVTIEALDSIIDATGEELLAIGAGDGQLAFASLRLARCTVIGQVLVHAIMLAEDSILLGLARVARRQLGCIRFCYVVPGSRTPRRFQCQSDLAENAPGADAALERLRVRPRFTSLRYSTPGYCQLHLACATEISAGASDQAEMGAFHDLYQPQRAANLRTRLAEFTPAAMDAGIIYGTQEAS